MTVASREPASRAAPAQPGDIAPGRPGGGADPIRPAHELISSGYTVLCCRPDGSVQGEQDGLYDFDARILSLHVLRLGGDEPIPLGSSTELDGRWSTQLIVHRRGGDAAGPALPQDAWGVRLDRRIGRGMAETIRITNHSMTTAATSVELDIAADFADVLDRGRGRSPLGSIEAAWDADATELVLRSSMGRNNFRDERGLSVRILGDIPAISKLPSNVDHRGDGRRLTWSLELPARKTWSVRLEFASLVDGDWRRPGEDPSRDALRDRWRASRARVDPLDALVCPAFERAAEDLLQLRNWELEPSDDGSAWFANAGVPWFTGFFGRDSITTGWQSAILGPELLRGALELAARTQGKRDDPWTEEEPGRMVHEIRSGPLARLNVRPHGRYYGSHTAGSMFVLGLSEAWHWTADDTLLRRHRDAAVRTIEWAERRGDRDGDGFLEYVTLSKDGLKNQGWKDSDEAIRYPDGNIVENPIATVEEQAFHFIALERMAEILAALDEDEGRVDALLARASSLRRQWHDAFWLPDEGFYAMALDAAKRPVATIGSNPGHALGVGIVPKDRARQVADRLLVDDLFSGWGVRTLSTRHPSYNPFAYHLGAVWPVENATIGLGFKRYGLDDHLDRLVDGMFAAIAGCRDLRLPEALAGLSRDDFPTPVPYPGANSPQAWSASATLQLVQIMLGLYPFAPMQLLGVVRPRLPEWLPSLTVRGLRVGNASVSIRFERREDGSASHDVIERDGTLHVVGVPSPNTADGTDVGPMDRLMLFAIDRAPGRMAKVLRIALGLATADD